MTATPTPAAPTTAEVLDGLADEDLWTHFNCVEITALAEAITAAGYSGVADRMIAAHAEGDEYDDDHFVAPGGAA